MTSPIIKMCEIHGELTKEQTLEKKDYRPPYYVYVRCRQCEHDRNRQQYLKHQEKKKAYGREYYYENREALNEYKRQWRAENSTRNKRTKEEWNKIKKDYVSEYNKRQSDNLTDAYVRSLLARTTPGLTNKDVNIPALIEIKRAAVLIKRKLKESSK